MKIFYALFFGFCLLATTPASAVVDKEECRGLANGGGVLIQIAHWINIEIDQILSNPSAPDYINKLDKARKSFKDIERAFTSVRERYNRKPPCGDFDSDVSGSFPPMHITAG